MQAHCRQSFRGFSIPYENSTNGPNVKPFSFFLILDNFLFICRVLYGLFIEVLFLVVEAMINQTRQQTKYCLGLSSQSSKKGNPEEDEVAFEKMRKDIEANQDNALSLCTEKVLLAQQAFDLVSCFSNFNFDCLIPMLCSIGVHCPISNWYLE